MRTAVEIGDRFRDFRNRGRSEFIRDRSGETVLRSVATPAASAATSAAPRAPLAIRTFFAAGNAGLFIAFVVAAFSVIGGPALDRFGCSADQFVVVARRAALAGLTTAAPASPPLAAM